VINVEAANTFPQLHGISADARHYRVVQNRALALTGFTCERFFLEFFSAMMTSKEKTALSEWKKKQLPPALIVASAAVLMLSIQRTHCVRSVEINDIRRIRPSVR